MLSFPILSQTEKGKASKKENSDGKVELKIEEDLGKIKAKRSLGFGIYGGLPYGGKVISKEEINFLGLHLSFFYSDFLKGRLSLLNLGASLDIQQFRAKSIPAIAGIFQVQLGYPVFVRGPWEFKAYLGGGYVYGKVEKKENFYFPVGELGPGFSYNVGSNLQLLGRIRQQFYFDPKLLFLSTSLQFGGAYVF